MARLSETVTITKYDGYYEVIINSTINSMSEKETIVEHLFEFSYNKEEEYITMLPRKYDESDYSSDLVKKDVILHPSFRKCLLKVINSKEGIPSSFPYKRIKTDGNYEWLLNELID